MLHDKKENGLSALFGRTKTEWDPDYIYTEAPLADAESGPAISIDHDDWIQTPHGLRPRECVISHDETNVIIQEMSEGLIVRYPDRKNGPKSVFYKSSQKCIQNAQEIRSQYAGPPGGWQIFGM